MNETPLVVSCQCGKRFKLKDKHRGTEFICPGCDRRLRIPGAPAASLPPPASVPESVSKPGIDWKYIGPGLSMTAAGAIGIAVFVWVIASGGARGRGVIYLPVISGVLLLMGLGSTAKGLLGDKIEWD